MIFEPTRLGPLQLRNRVIRAAAFEGMCPDHLVSSALIDYHQSVAAGGVGMTTVAYASVSKSGLSFPHQLWLRDEAVPGLKKLTSAVHDAGARCSIQIGHCGNMAKKELTGTTALAPSGHFNLYGPHLAKKMSKADIHQVIEDFGRATRIVKEAGFDAVEVHAGHGYLISQFLSPHTNRRTDDFGGSLERRSLFMRLVIRKVKENLGDDMALLVKLNMHDGFKSGMQVNECLAVAKMLEEEKVDAIVLSGGFVSKAPMFIMRGAMPIKVLAHHMHDQVMKFFTRAFGKYLIQPKHYEEAYFLELARQFRRELEVPLVYVGGLVSAEKIETTLKEGFEFVAIARALLRDPDFVNKILNKQLSRSTCDACNYCIAVMYSQEVSCIQNEQNPAMQKLLRG